MGSSYFSRGWIAVSTSSDQSDLPRDQNKGRYLEKDPPRRGYFLRCTKCNVIQCDDGLCPSFECKNCGEAAGEVPTQLKQCCIKQLMENVVNYYQTPKEATEVEIAVNKDGVNNGEMKSVVDKVIKFFEEKSRLVYKGAMFSIEDNEYRVVDSKPYVGYVKVTKRTRIKIEMIYSSRIPIKRALLITGKKYNNVDVEDIKRDVFSTPHKGELIVIKNTSSKINNYDFYIKNSIPDYGIINNDTVLSIENKNSNKISSITFVLISESSSPLSLTEIDDLLNNYLNPYFHRSTNHYIEKGDILSINDKSFFITDLSPLSGFTSSSTSLKITDKKTKEDCINSITIDDAKLAREMTNIESPEPSTTTIISTSPQVTSSNQEIYRRLNTMFSHAVVTSRPIRLRILSEYILNREDLLNIDGENDDSLRLFTQEQSENMDRLIRALPTFEVDQKYIDSINKTGDDDYNQKCVICMEKYQIKEKLKTLPCFHVFHSDCIDAWLKQHNSCPICKHGIEEEV